MFLGIAFSKPSHASETVTYTYDALGRLTRSETSGGENNGLKTEITMDNAGNRTNYKVTGSGSDDDSETPPSFSINNASATEGGNLTFTVAKTGTVSNSYSVSYATANNSALAGSDFTTKSGQLTFSASQTSQTVVVSSINDSIVESTEDFYVNLSGPTGGATLSNGQGVGTITDDDGGNETPPSFSINNASATEGGNLTFTVTKSGAVSNSYSVSYATANNSALADSDFTAKSGQLTFSASQTSQTVVVSSINDSIVESTENFYVNLSGPTGGATLSDSQGVGTITDNDTGGSNSPPVAVNDTVATFGSTATKNVVANDTDPDNDTLTVISASGPGVSVTISNGTTLFVTNLSFDTSVTYTVSDGNGGTDTGILYVYFSCGPFC